MGDDIVFVVDSGATIPDILLSDIKHELVPLHIAFNEEQYLDGIDITPDEFYPKMQAFEQEMQNLPTTSQPSTEEFKAGYERAFEQGDHIIALPLIKKYSDTYDRALGAKNEMQNENIHVIDTGSGSGGISYFIMTALSSIKEGDSIDNVVKKTQRIDNRIHTLLVPNPDYLAYRVTWLKKMLNAAGRVGVTINQKYVLKIEDGKFGFVGRRRTINKSLNLMGEKLYEKVGDKPILAYSIYTDTPFYSNKVEDMLRDFNIISNRYMNGVEKITLCPAIGRYIGPGGFGVMALDTENLS